jgi:uncharacterized protein YqjF (DUF2071 family)
MPTPLPPVIPRIALPVMLQGWRRLTFLHWRYRPAALANRLPPRLTIDTFDGAAWLGITPFLLEGLRPPLAPPLPWISRFPETNCRTYVIGPDGEPGIWFFSLDAARIAAVAGARAMYGLPYAWSDMRVAYSDGRVEYASRRTWPDREARTAIEVEYGGAAPKRDLETFLTERYRLYSLIGGRLTYTNVEHARWPLMQARVKRMEQTLTHAAGLPAPEGEPLAHYSPGVKARIALPAAI